ncbi:MAG: ABC transporter permease [Terriglobia bacterium]|jgi:predicted permease
MKLAAWLRRRKQREQELDEEIRAHLAMAISERIEHGEDPATAERNAQREFGNEPLVKETTRDMWGWRWLEALLQDLRYGLRQLRRSPGMTAVAVLTLALGIGANTAIFSLIDTVMLRSLPVEKPEELVEVRRYNPRWGSEGSPSFTNPLWEQVRDRQDVFSGVFASGEESFDLAQGGAVENANGIFVSGSYFATLGVRPAAGRLFTAADDKRGCPAVAVLSYGFWRDHYGGAESAVGQTLSLSNHPFQIIGASGPGFYGAEVGHKFDVAIPVCTAAIFDEKEQRLDHRSWWWLGIMGRVKPGISPERLKARLDVLSPQIFTAAVPQGWDPKNQQEFLKQSFLTFPAATGVSGLRREFTEPLNILMAVVGLVLLIACANIASLMLARAATRHREIAVRQALGASRMRLIRQLLTECILLSSAGAVVGVLFARWGSALLVRYISTANNQVFLDLSLDGRVLGFTAAIAVLTGVLFGVLPALRSTRVSLTAAMKGRGDTERHGHFRSSKWIVAAQVALSLVLLVAAGLFLRSFAKLAMLDIGFDRNNVLLVNANLKAAHVPPERRWEIYQQIENRLRALPGVVSASRSWNTPISGYEWNQDIQADSPNSPTGEAALTYFNAISPAYFETLRTPLLAGRVFNDHDTKNAPPVAIVNQTMARKFFPNLNPIGRYFRTAEVSGSLAPPIQIVGLVRDSKYESLREETYPTAFFPIAQQTPGIDDVENFELRTAIPPSSLASAVQSAVAGVSKEISIDFHTLAEQVNDSMVQERLLALLSGFFGALALLLAMIGLYGTLSYLVTQRQTEFGVRMALGAQPGSILRLVMRDVVVVLAGGLAVGICISLATGQLLQKMLFGLDARDTVTLAAAVVTLSAVAFLAAYLPARRATKVDPMVALRYE